MRLHKTTLRAQRVRDARGLGDARGRGRCTGAGQCSGGWARHGGWARASRHATSTIDHNDRSLFGRSPRSLPPPSLASARRPPSARDAHNVAHCSRVGDDVRAQYGVCQITYNRTSARNFNVLKSCTREERRAFGGCRGPHIPTSALRKICAAQRIMQEHATFGADFRRGR